MDKLGVSVSAFDCDIIRSAFIKSVIEESIPAAAQRSLGSLPYPAVVVPDRSDELGHAHLIRVRPGGFDAGADPRSDGGSLAG